MNFMKLQAKADAPSTEPSADSENKSVEKSNPSRRFDNRFVLAAVYKLYTALCIIYAAYTSATADEWDLHRDCRCRTVCV